MTYQVKFPKKTLFNSIQSGLRLEIEIDPQMKSCGAFCYSFSNRIAIIRISNLTDGETYAHEFVHACQVLSGPPSPGNEMFRFDRISLENYLKRKGIPFEEWCAEYVEELLERMIKKGLYEREEFLTEYLAYYVENAISGKKVLEAIWADTQKFIRRKDSFWRLVQKEKRRQWIKDNLIHLPLPFLLVLIIGLSFVFRPKDKPIFYNPLPLGNQVIQK